MKASVFIALLTFSSITLFAQNKNTWISFYNQDSTLVGFKDYNGDVKIEPKFTMVTTALKFENIIAVMEENNQKWKSYYLTKLGKVVGIDSIHFFDNTPDCENEGFIRFRDSKTDKVGLFDKNGNNAIPAAYNEMSIVRNGMIVALKDAKKIAIENGEHFRYKGGKNSLLDTQNTVLIADFKEYENINFYSLEKTNKPSDDKIRKSFKAKENLYYTFVDFELEFKKWLTNDLLVNLTTEKLIDASLKTITWESKDGWETTNTTKYITDNFVVLKKGLEEFTLPKCDYHVSTNGLNQFIYQGNEFEKYYDTCGQAKEWQFPVLSLIINHSYKIDLKQNTFEFLRTDEGYKLISVTIRN